MVIYMLRRALLVVALSLLIPAAPALGAVKVEWDGGTASSPKSGAAIGWETGFRTTSEWSLGENFSFILRDRLAIKSGAKDWTGVLERCYLRYESGPVRLNLGRQAVSWGVGWFFRPTDRITPLAPLSKDETRPGKDLALLRITTSPLTAIDMIGGEKLFAARSEWRLGETNLRLLGILRQEGENILGLDFQGGLKGLYGETAFKWQAGSDLKSGEGVFLLGWKSMVGKGRLWFLEFLRDNSGEHDPELYDYSLLLGGGRIYLGQDYAVTGIQIPWDELTSFTVGAVANVDDGGALLTIQSSILLTDNLDVNLGAGLLAGGDKTEFATEANGARFTFNLAAKYYF